MKTFITTTLATALFVSLLGCEKTEPNEPKTWDNAPERLGSGLEGAAQGPINAVKATGSVIKSGAESVGNALSGDDDKK
jgi:hypothetical protein